MSLQNLYNMIQ